MKLISRHMKVFGFGRAVSLKRQGQHSRLRARREPLEPRRPTTQSPAPSWTSCGRAVGFPQQPHRLVGATEEKTTKCLRYLVSVLALATANGLAYAQDSLVGKIYDFHSTEQSGCPALDWHVVTQIHHLCLFMPANLLGWCYPYLSRSR
jgi:hypothetical protein